MNRYPNLKFILMNSMPYSLYQISGVEIIKGHHFTYISQPNYPYALKFETQHWGHKTWFENEALRFLYF